MIVVDSSALIAIVLREPDAEACFLAMRGRGPVHVSAATLAETLIVAIRKNIEPVTEADARNAADAFRRWGKGRHPAALNYGDCFAYALAKELNCPLLFVGGDFSDTDIVSALDLGR
ncbi:MAG: type II toxin-antitoxin system VapC family toxin [Roseiarcus sp.]